MGVDPRPPTGPARQTLVSRGGGIYELITCANRSDLRDRAGERRVRFPDRNRALGRVLRTGFKVERSGCDGPPKAGGEHRATAWCDPAADAERGPSGGIHGRRRLASTRRALVEPAL